MHGLERRIIYNFIIKDLKSWIHVTPTPQWLLSIPFYITYAHCPSVLFFADFGDPHFSHLKMPYENFLWSFCYFFFGFKERNLLMKNLWKIKRKLFPPNFQMPCILRISALTHHFLLLIYFSCERSYKRTKDFKNLVSFNISCEHT